MSCQKSVVNFSVQYLFIYLFVWPICPLCQQLGLPACTIQICYRTISCKQPCFVDPRFIGPVSCVCVRLSDLQHYISCPGAQRCQGVSHSHKNNKCWPFPYTNSDRLWFNICPFHRILLISCSYKRDCALVSAMCSCRSYAVGQLIIRTKLYNTATTCLSCLFYNDVNNRVYQADNLSP